MKAALRLAFTSSTLAALALGVGPAGANTIDFEVTVLPTIGNQVFPCGGGGVTSVQGPSAVSLAYGCGPNNGTIFGAAAAAPGHVGAEATSTGGGSMRAIALFQDDVIFSTLDPNAPQDNIFVALNLAFTGTIRVPGDLNLNQFADASYSLVVDIGPQSFTRSLAMFNQRGSNSVVNGLNFSSGGDNVVDGVGATISGILTTPTFEVPLNSIDHLTVSLTVLGEGLGSIDMLHSVDFPVGQDVFTMPVPGVYTANAAASQLVNNRFVGAVPEPAGAVLWALGLAGLGLWRQGRRKLS